jgi:AhpC/TSA antioxidant enzyme
VVQLHRDIAKIHAAGAELIVIGNGAPHFIEGFREHTRYDGPLYTDPSLATFEAAQLKRGVVNTLSLRALGGTLGSLARGQRQGRTQGDPWQQGGVVVVAPSGEVQWQHASERPGDNATVVQILQALALAG